MGKERGEKEETNTWWGKKKISVGMVNLSSIISIFTEHIINIMLQ